MCHRFCQRCYICGLINGFIPDYVEINTPLGRKVKLKLLKKQIGNNYAECCVQKDAGDDPDVTNGAFIFCRVERIESNGQNHCIEKENTYSNGKQQITVIGGKGVGVVTKPGLQVKVGLSAINPVPMQMIQTTILDVIGTRKCKIKAIISVLDGEKIAKRTFNSRLGICGGISIIGTTGFVRPMSEEAIKTSLKCELNVASALGHNIVVLAPGNLAETATKKWFAFAKEQVVLMSNFAGYMLNAAFSLGFKEIIITGHPGKLAKLIRGDFNTHSSNSKPANDIIIDIISNKLSGNRVLDEINESTTVEGIIQTIEKRNELDVFNIIAERVRLSASAFLKEKLEIGVVLFDMQKQIIGLSMKDDTRKSFSKTNISFPPKNDK